MSKKRGRPVRQFVPIAVQAAPQDEAEGRKIDDSHIEILPDRVYDSGLISNTAAEDMYDKFESHRIATINSEEQAETVPPQEAVAPEPAAVIEGTPEPAKPVTPPVEEKPQAKEPDVYVKETPQQRDEKIEKTVPLAALHEARNEIKELKKRLSGIETKDIMPPSQQDATQYGYNAENAEYEYITKKDFQSIQQKLDVIEREKSDQRLEANISFANEALSKEGFSGFKELGVDVVSKILNEMYAEDPIYAQAHDNPEGWMKIWREEHPKFKKFFVERDIERVMQEKTERKQNAQMVASPGIKTDEALPLQTARPMTREESFAEFTRERKAGLL